jgi:hypothetical protein
VGFDKNDPQPLVVTTEKSTTKVNIGVILGVLVFLVFSVGAVVWIWQNPDENAQDVQQKVDERKQP